MKAQQAAAHAQWGSAADELRNVLRIDAESDGAWLMLADVEFLRQHPQILRAVKTLGGWDLLLYIAVDHPSQYHTIIKDIKRTFATIIKHYDAWIAYKEHIYTPMPKVIGG